MNVIVGLIVVILLIALLYYFANPANHNSWNGGNAPAFNPKTREGKIIHNSLQAIGLIVVWIFIIGIILVSIFS